MAREVLTQARSAVAKKPGWRGACVVIGLVSAWLSSCSTPATDACTPGAERACQTEQCDGTERCSGAPARWASCECNPNGGAGGEGGNTGSASGSAGSGTGGEGELALLGSPCATDGGCPAGALCLRDDAEDFFGGGPPGGVCVAECSDEPGRCAEFENAVCVSTQRDGANAPAYCFASCALGESAADKCGARADVACDALVSDDDGGFCRPFCTSGEQCPGARCDRRFGVCTESPVSGGDFGQPCSAGDEEIGCSGLCVELGEDYAVCSHRCSFAGIEPCTNAGEGTGLCAFAAPGGSIGDIGYCAELCDCDDDCTHPDGVCDAFSSEEVRELLGKSGVCAPMNTSTGERLECD